MNKLRRTSLLVSVVLILALLFSNIVSAAMIKTDKNTSLPAVAPNFEIANESQSLTGDSVFNTDNIVEGYKDKYMEQVQKVLKNTTLSESYKSYALKAIKAKYTKPTQKSDTDKNQEFSLDEEFNKHMEQLKESETILGKMMNKYTKGEDYSVLAASLAKEDKIKTMYKIVELLKTDSLQKNEREALEEYLIKYAQYAGDAFLENKSKELQSANKAPLIATITTAFANYDRSAAGTHITTYTHDDDTDDSVYCMPSPPPSSYTWGYPNLRGLGGDCANYASQALVAGGIPQDKSNGWYCYYYNVTPFIYVATDQNKTSFWKCWDIGNAWKGADSLYSYLSSRIFKTEMLTNSQITNSTTYSRLYSDLWVGDLIIFEKPAGIGGWFWEKYHVSEVSGYVYPDIRLASHSKNYLSDKLIDVANRTTDNRYYIMYIKDGN